MDRLSRGRVRLRLFVLALLSVLVLAAGAFLAWVHWASQRGEFAPLSASQASRDASTQTTVNINELGLIERGAYLAKAGNCAACHSAPGEAEYAGGRGLETPFGMAYSSNLTPDLQSGLGNWTADDLWRALHHGRGKAGRFLNPVFPFVNYTLMSREDSDALYAFLRSRPAVFKANREHALKFPFNSQWALRVWRALYFRPGVFQARPQKSEDWNRGAYLVEGAGHCGACHSPRSSLGGIRYSADQAASLSGAVMPVQGWYAPSLRTAQEAGLQGMSMSEAVSLLKHGINRQATVSGPMAEVVYRSTQHLSTTDLSAIAIYLQDLPGSQTERMAIATTQAPISSQDNRSELRLGSNSEGQKLYESHCSDCHGLQGEGAVAGGVMVYPRLAGNRAVLMSSPLNLIRVLLHGGFAPATQGNPKPFGMPPFSQTLNDTEVAQVLSYVRQAWGNTGKAVYTLDVVQSR
jgi:mono/diheme cytochrome c family protein